MSGFEERGFAERGFADILELCKGIQELVNKALGTPLGTPSSSASSSPSNNPENADPPDPAPTCGHCGSPVVRWVCDTRTTVRHWLCEDCGSCLGDDWQAPRRLLEAEVQRDRARQDLEETNKKLYKFYEAPAQHRQCQCGSWLTSYVFHADTRSWYWCCDDCGSFAPDGDAWSWPNKYEADFHTLYLAERAAIRWNDSSLSSVGIASDGTLYIVCEKRNGTWEVSRKMDHFAGSSEVLGSFPNRATAKLKAQEHDRSKAGARTNG